MRTWNTTVALVAAFMTAVASRAEEEHPRILATGPLLEAIRAEARKPGTHHRQVYEAIKARVDLSCESMVKAYRDGAGEEPLKPEDYAWGYRAREAAFLALLATTPEDRTRYAALSHKAAMETALVKAGDLAGAMGAMSIALSYDWGYAAWTPEQREAVRRRALAHLNATGGQDRIAREFGFNKGGVIGGSELVLMVALGEETTRKARYDHVKKHLIQHIETCYDAWGVSQEGPGYSEYPGSFLLPAVFVTNRLGDPDLTKAAAGRGWWKMLMYAWTFQETARQSVMWGVGSGGGPGEGWATLLIGTVPQDQLPYYLWFYNRSEGVNSPKPPDQRFDPSRGNSPLAMLLYPVGAAEKDPTGAFPRALYDETRGFAFLRSRWKDWDDIQVTISADAVKNAIGWDAPDALKLNLLAFNTRFFGGPAKKGEIGNHSTLVVDGRYGSGKSLGRADTFEPRGDGAYVIVDGGATYADLKCDSVKRHLAAKFAEGRSRALLVTLDRVKSAQEHAYTWQGNLGGPTDDDGVRASAGQEAGRPTFLLQGRNDGYVKGWVLHPADAQVVARGDPLQINVRGGDVDIWVVMLVGQGAPPQARIGGSGLGSTLAVDGDAVRFDPDAGRIAVGR